ncbi:hypothetical protein ACVWYG_002526 [Pedobacter sp. UYEF25]
MKTNRSFKIAAIFLIGSSLMLGCTSKGKKTTTVDTTITTTKVKTDTLPPLDKDSASTTRPEVIKNGSSPKPVSN